MARGLHSDVVTELATDDLTLCDLLQFQIGSTTYYKTTAYHDIVHDIEFECDMETEVYVEREFYKLTEIQQMEAL